MSSSSTNHIALSTSKRNPNGPRPSLNLSRVSKRAMLVKVPRWIADIWKSHPPHQVLAHMSPTSNHSANKPEFHIKLSESPLNKDVTQNFTLKVSNTNVTSIFAFIESEPGQCAEILTSVSSEATLIPDTDAQYHQIAKTRAELAAKPKRQVRVMTMQELKGHTNTNITATNLDQLVLSGKEPRSSSDGYRATRTLTVQELKSALISLFQSYPYWSSKSLADKTNQPQAYIREILSEIAVLVKRGPYANHWTLNPDLQRAMTGGASIPESVSDADQPGEKPSTPDTTSQS